MKKENQAPKPVFLFERVNYKFLFLAIALIVVGFVFMAGGANDNPEVFNQAVFNFQRIRLAPTLVLVGFGVAI